VVVAEEVVVEEGVEIRRYPVVRQRIYLL